MLTPIILNGLVNNALQVINFDVSSPFTFLCLMHWILSIDNELCSVTPSVHEGVEWTKLFVVVVVIVYFHLGISSWGEAHRSRGHKATARGG